MGDQLLDGDLVVDDEPGDVRPFPDREVPGADHRQQLANELIAGLISVLRDSPMKATRPNFAALSRAAFCPAGLPEQSMATSTPRPRSAHAAVPRDSPRC